MIQDRPLESTGSLVMSLAVLYRIAVAKKSKSCYYFSITSLFRSLWLFWRSDTQITKNLQSIW